MYPYPSTPDEWSKLTRDLSIHFPEDIVQDTLLHLYEKYLRNEPLRTLALNWCRMDAAGDLKTAHAKAKRQRRLAEMTPCEGHTAPLQHVRAELSMVAAAEGKTLKQLARIRRLRDRASNGYLAVSKSQSHPPKSL